MTSSAVIQRYAQALYLESAGEPEVHADVALLSQTLEQSRELQLFLASPVVSRLRKESLLDKLFAPRVHSQTLTFLHLLIKREREELLGGILKQFQVLSDQQAGIVQVDVKVASPLDDNVRAQLKSTLESKLGHKVRLSVARHADLMGGIVLRIGDKVYDGSVRYQLSVLRASMHV